MQGGRPGAGRRFLKGVGEYFQPQEAIPGSLYRTIMLTGGLGAVVLWCILTYGGFVSPLFLPSPTDILRTGVELYRDGSLIAHTRASTFVIFSGWALAAVLAVPLGILMGSFKVVEALIEPVVDFVRYLPVSALIPLLILYIGIGTAEKIAVIFIGTFFQLILLVADVSAHVSKDLLDAAYTLGASRSHVITRVLIPATLPGVMDNLRITMGWRGPTSWWRSWWRQIGGSATSSWTRCAACSRTGSSWASWSSVSSGSPQTSSSSGSTASSFPGPRRCKGWQPPSWFSATSPWSTPPGGDRRSRPSTASPCKWESGRS